MANNSDSCAQTGCGLLVILGGLCLLLSAVEAYVKSLSDVNLLVGALVGSVSGGLAAVLVPFFVKTAEAKADLGPLPFLSHLLPVSWLRKKYLRDQTPPPLVQPPTPQNGGNSPSGG